MPNAHFRTVMLLRLGAVEVPDGAVCSVPKSDTSSGDFCLHPLTSPLIHPHLCRCGPARLRAHTALNTVLAKESKRAGAHVNVEKACPQLYECDAQGTVTEAILDVVLHFPGGPL